MGKINSTPPRAVLDLGTNSTRFLLARPTDDKFDLADVVCRGSRVTRLGEGVDDEGRLSPRAIERVLAAVEDYDRQVKAEAGNWAGAIATSACRRVKNSDTLLEEVEKIIGCSPEIISGQQEAALIYKGVKASLPLASEGVVADIGGGSTEIINYEAGEIVNLESFPVGVVSLREKCVAGQRWEKKMTTCVLKQLKTVFSGSDFNKNRLYVAGGTGTTLAALKLELEEYDPNLVHGEHILIEQLRSIRSRLEALTFKEIARLPQIMTGREDVIIPGLYILEKIIDRSAAKEAIVSDVGILIGLLIESATK